MTLNILAFGIAREILGGASLQLAPGEHLTAATLKERLAQQYPRPKQLTSFMIAVNGEYAQPDQVITAQDEVAIIPPVSGG